jgi:hypothetical protein
MVRPQRIDEITRGQHFYLTEADECYYFYEFTARAGFQHSSANQFIFNFKKSVSRRGRPEYWHKEQAIKQAIALLQGTFAGQPLDFWQGATFVPMPPSKKRDDPEYDDRVVQVVRGLCEGTAGELRELLVQSASYKASHEQSDGERIRPDELATLYTFDSPAAPRSTVILLDDVLTTGCHFRAAKEAVLRMWPQTVVLGLFLARVARPDPLLDFDVLT